SDLGSRPSMIHIATVHWAHDRWIDIQLHYLARNIEEPFLLYAWLDKGMEEHAGKFFYSTDVPVKEHEYKLTVLGDLVAHAADPGHHLMSPARFANPGDQIPLPGREPGTQALTTLHHDPHRPLIELQRSAERRALQRQQPIQHAGQARRLAIPKVREEQTKLL